MAYFAAILAVNVISNGAAILAVLMLGLGALSCNVAFAALGGVGTGALAKAALYLASNFASAIAVSASEAFLAFAYIALCVAFIAMSMLVEAAAYYSFGLCSAELQVLRQYDIFIVNLVTSLDRISSKCAQRHDRDYHHDSHYKSKRSSFEICHFRFSLKFK